MLSPLDALPYLLTAAAILSFYAAARFLARDRRRRARKHITFVDPLAPTFARTERYCEPCNNLFVDPPHEWLTRCNRCGGQWTRSLAVVDAQPTDEPPTQPDGPRAA